MVLNTIKLSLGSVIILLAIACTNGNIRVENSAKSKIKLSKDFCNVILADGRKSINTLGCRNCHSINDYWPRSKPNIPLFIEISALDSIKLADYIFKDKHNGMYTREFKKDGQRIDSLDNCQKRAIIAYIKGYSHSNPKD